MCTKLEKAGKFNENSLKEKLTMSAREIGVLNQKLTESEYKMTQKSNDFEKIKLKYEQNLEDLKDHNMDSESDITICFESREQELKKMFKSKLEQYQRENVLIEKKYNLYKDMYKKLKNEKLDIVQYGSNSSDPKILFLNPACNANSDLNLSMISQIPLTSDNDEVLKLRDELKAANDSVKDLEAQNEMLLNQKVFQETIMNKEIERLTKENAELKKSNQNQVSAQVIQRKYDNLFDEMMSQKLSYKELENINNSNLEALKKANQKIADKDTEIFSLQDVIATKSMIRSDDGELIEAKKQVMAFTTQLTEELLKYELNEHKLKTEYDAKIEELTLELLKLQQKEGVFMNEEKDNNKKVEHKRIVCDFCYKCPIYGSRYKSLTHENHDLCEACYVKQDVKEPVLKMSDIPSINPEKLEELMPYLKCLFKDIKEGKCTVLYNNGFTK